MKTQLYFLNFINYTLFVLFVYAAVNKIIDFDQFYNDLRNSPLFNDPTIASLVSWAVPLSEIAVALLLLTRRYRLKGFYASAGLMLLFTLYISGILLFSDSIACSCGGIISNLTWEEHLVFNACMTLLACLGIYLFPTKQDRQ